jgi:hypothetical protein
MGQPVYLKDNHPAKSGKPTRRTETSKYPQEKKIIMIPPVVASEKGRAQTCVACCTGVIGLRLEVLIKLKFLERDITEGENPVGTN